MKKRKKKKMGAKGQLLGIFSLFTAVIFMPTTIILLMGMIPTIVVAALDRSGKGTKPLTIGAMNLAGCAPFLIELWSKGHTAEISVMLISDPRAMSVMYAAAGIGYLISWAMSGIVGTVMVQRSGVRLKDIKKRQAALVERWGPEVTGEIPLDAYGFPIDMPMGDLDDDEDAAQDNARDADKKTSGK